MERWKKAHGFEDFYEVSDQGNVRSLCRDSVIDKNGLVLRKSGGIARKTVSGKYGHQFVTMTGGGKRKMVSVHRLVLLAFVGEPKKGQECRHKNGDPKDNRLNNLVWGSHKENMKDRADHGNYAKKDEHPMAKITQHQAEFIKSSNLPGTELSKMFGIGTSQVSRIKRGLSRS